MEFETKGQQKMALKRRYLGKKGQKGKGTDCGVELISHTNYFLVCMGKGVRRRRKVMVIASICPFVSDMNTTMQFQVLMLGISLM